MSQQRDTLGRRTGVKGMGPQAIGGDALEVARGEFSEAIDQVRRTCHERGVSADKAFILIRRLQDGVQPIEAAAIVLKLLGQNLVAKPIPAAPASPRLCSSCGGRHGRGRIPTDGRCKTCRSGEAA